VRRNGGGVTLETLPVAGETKLSDLASSGVGQNPKMRRAT